MTAVSDADRAKAAELARQARWAPAVLAPIGQAADAIAAALAEARAPYDRLTADLRALAEEIRGEWRRDPSQAAYVAREIAAHLDAVVAAAQGAKA